MPSLYRQEILERYRFPRHKGTIARPHAQAEKINAFCGDEVVLFLLLDKEKRHVVEAKFDGQGCALMTASADMLCEAVRDKTIDELRRFSAEDMLGLYGEAPSPGRIPCVLLPYEALKQALAAIF